MRWSRLFRSLKVLFVAILFVLLLAPERLATADDESYLASLVGPRVFDYLAWEARAFGDKGIGILGSGRQFMPQEQQKQVVLEYLELVREAQMLESRLTQVYSDPQVSDPARETAVLQSDLRAIRAALREQRPLAEAIVQQQVATVLSDEGLSLFGAAWPPVLMHMTPLPALLVVSPRDRIESKYQVSLADGLSVADYEDMEAAVFEDLDHAALVVPLGGIGTYPAMIRETSSLPRLVEVVAHEWAHHWLTLKPLGLNYATDPATRIMNETVASLVDVALAERVLQRYYPELVQPDVPETASQPVEEDGERPLFDFQAELAHTRTRADELLAAGQVEEAEAYMETRRQLFLEHGYQIRKLNQAFFAFYGAYAAEPGGAQGSNPIGPMLLDIYNHSNSVSEFLHAVAPLTSFEALQALHAALIPPQHGG